jgi:hypothetical protein
VPISLVQVAQNLFLKSVRPVKMEYDATGSSAGVKNFVNNDLFNQLQNNDFGCSELPLTDAQQGTIVDATSAATSVGSQYRVATPWGYRRRR